MSAFAPRPGQDCGDEASRQRIRESLHESLIVEASAGTGKTTELVGRIVNVLASGVTTVDRIAAVTFTHKAAGELKLRLRQELDRKRMGADDPGVIGHLTDALARLEEASIGTIHAFCAQILRERPVEAVVDPSFAEMNEQEGARLYKRAFRAWIEDRLGRHSPGLQRALVRLASVDAAPGSSPIESLQYAGRALVEWRDFPAAWKREAFDREGEIDELASYVANAARRMTQAFRCVHEVAAWIDRAESGAGRDYDTLESLLVGLERELGRMRRKGAEDLQARLSVFSRRAGADLASALRDEMQGLVDRYEEMKRTAGKLDFLDLLIVARDMVRDRRDVREYLQRRFSHLFIDEFQDTDPLQAELLLLLSADDPAQDDWLQVTPVAGKLFAVGDPKQSIYKFRRADVVLYRTIRDRLAGRGVGFVRLRRSFRSVPAIQEFANNAFEPEMTGDEYSGQAQYSPLEAHAEDWAGQPAVVALPVPEPYAKRYVAKGSIDASLPGAITGYIEWLLNESGWTVRENGQRVAISARHVCILFRRFLNFGRDLTRDYTRSLEARGISHLLVGSRSFHDREEVETLRTALTAIEWPEDELSVYATLRGSLFSIPDEHLLRYRGEGWRWHPFAPRPEDPAEPFRPICEALELLAELHRQRNWRPVAATIHQLLEAVRAHAGFALRPGGAQVLANVYRLTDLARTFETTGGISFRGFVEELDAQAGRAETAEAPVLEEGAEGVRLMTVHTAKGLEFPVVILADMTARIAARDPDRYVDGEARLCSMRLLRCSPWELLENEAQERAREEAEGVRVAYVAATRAKDLLVVPVVGDEEFDGWLKPLNKALYPPTEFYRRAREAPGCPEFGPASVLSRPPDLYVNGEISVQPGLHRPRHGNHSVVWWDPGRLRLEASANFGVRQSEILAPDEGGNSEAAVARFHAWGEQRKAKLEAGGRATLNVFAATSARPLPEGFECEVEEIHLDRPAGRPYGPRFGSLVHSVMGHIDLDARPAEVHDTVALHARTHGATEAEAEAAEGAVRAALEHPLMGEARGAERVYREYPVVFRADAADMLEGIIDLAFFRDGTWNVVDFKTDAEFPTRAAKYRLQIRWYALALHRITGRPVRGWLLGV